MKIKVVGIETVDYFSKKQNKQVKGVSLYFNRDSDNPNLIGLLADKVWLSEKLVCSMGFVPSVSDEVNLVYDFDGRNSYLVGYQKLTEDNSAGKED